MAIIMVIIINHHHYHLGRRLTGGKITTERERKIAAEHSFSLLYFFCGGKGIIISDSLDRDGTIPSGSCTYIALCELHMNERIFHHQLVSLLWHCDLLFT